MNRSLYDIVPATKPFARPKSYGNYPIPRHHPPVSKDFPPGLNLYNPASSHSPALPRKKRGSPSPLAHPPGAWHVPPATAITKSFNSASGNTTVPISRPSITMPFAFPISCCLATNARRTKPRVATGLTLSATSMPRISFSTFTPFK